MKVHKDNQHSVTLRPFLWRGKNYLMLCVGLYVAFDPDNAAYQIKNEQDFWKAIPSLFSELGQAPLIDHGLPKSGAEVLIAGYCRSPHEKWITSQEVSFSVGPITRKIAVFGDRERLPGGGVSDPLPFKAMPLIWEKALGGPENEINPHGKGLNLDNKPNNILPNLEDPLHFILSKKDTPAPICPFPIDIANPLRRKISGTYDQNWLENRWPAYPDDCHPDFFFNAQKAQRLYSETGKNLFFQGGESIEIKGMHHQFPHIRSKLPTEKIRSFVLTKKEFTPFDSLDSKGNMTLPYAKDLDEKGIFHEVTMRLDTVWLFPDLLGAFVMYRGLLEVADDEMDDILRVLVVTENGEAKSINHYREELDKRAYPSVEIDLDPFVEAQKAVTKAIKKAKDYPKTLNNVKKSFLRQLPVMPLSLGDIAFSAQKTIASGRATLDLVEKETLALRDQFSHLVSFDLSIFPKMRSILDQQENNLKETLNQAQTELEKINVISQERAKKTKLAIEDALAPKPYNSEKTLAIKAEKLKALQPQLEKLDTFSAEGMLTAPESINPWHDRGFPFVIAAKRYLQRNDPLLQLIYDMGFEDQTLEQGFIGFLQTPSQDNVSHWGDQKENQEFTLPSGFCVPRFSGKTLISLFVYPLSEQTQDILASGNHEDDIFHVPGSDLSPLFLEAAFPDGAILVTPDDLSARYAEQEAGDFCHIVATKNPQALNQVENLLPLLKKEAENPMPILVILPPNASYDLFESWQKMYPQAIALYLPENCSHILKLQKNGYRLRRLALDALPLELAQKHDFDFPLPQKNQPPQPFTLNLPLPTKEELQGAIEKLIVDIRAHFPNPETALKDALLRHKEMVLSSLNPLTTPSGVRENLSAVFDHALSAPAPKPISGPEAMKLALARIERTKELAEQIKEPKAKAELLEKLNAAKKQVQEMEKKVLSLEQLREEGLAKLEAVKQGDLPEDIKKAFAEKGMDPHALKLLSREEVKAILNHDKNLEKRNLQGLDLSNLDFTGANLAHALCAKTNFANAVLDHADFTFTLANEADFTGASLKNANFKQTVMQKAILSNAVLDNATIDLSTFGETQMDHASFKHARISSCNFTKADLNKADFTFAHIALTAFNEVNAAGANFSEIRASKCLFQKTQLENASFNRACLPECLFQGASAKAVSFENADLKKCYTDANSDLSFCDFAYADLSNASLRMSYFQHADFYQAKLENALIAQCDFSHAKLDGINAAGCQFIKCDMNSADLSGSNLIKGSLYKSRLSAADLTQTNLYAANLSKLTINRQTRFEKSNLKRTLFAGKEEALRDIEK